MVVIRRSCCSGCLTKRHRNDDPCLIIMMEAVKADTEDPFEAVFLAEDRLYREGYAEGLVVGKEEGRHDGVSTGHSTGRKLGEELGYYLGFTETILSTVVKEGKNERKLRLLSSLLELVKDFRHLDTSSADHQLNLTRVRAKFSQVLSLLQVSQSLHPHRQGSSLNF